MTGARVLDLFAGTGALGLEAMSRGAAFALFVDDGAEARALIRENVAALGLGGTTRIFRRDATKLGAAHPIEPFSLVFLDPPYGRGLAEQALTSARAGGWLAADALDRGRGGGRRRVRRARGLSRARTAARRRHGTRLPESRRVMMHQSSARCASHRDDIARPFVPSTFA